MIWITIAIYWIHDDSPHFKGFYIITLPWTLFINLPLVLCDLKPFNLKFCFY